MKKKKKNNSLNYRELAEYVLQRFKIDNLENMNDEEILLQFGKMSDEEAIFDDSVDYPSGDLTKCKSYKFKNYDLMSEKELKSLNISKYDIEKELEYKNYRRIVSILWCQKFSPEFIKVHLNDNEWKKLFNKGKKYFIEEKKKQEKFNYKDLVNEVLETDDIYVEDKYLRLSKIMNVSQDTFNKYQSSVEEKPKFFKFLVELSKIFNYDINTLFQNIDINEEGEVFVKVSKGKKIE